MIERILVPVDRSERSTQALEFALEEYPEPTIVVLTVVAMENFYPSTNYQFRSFIHNEPPEKVDEILEEWGESVIEETLNVLDLEERDVKTDVVIGDVSDSIVEYSDEHDIDMIVIGSHGRTGISRILLGSVAETVTRRSSVPVTVFR